MFTANTMASVAEALGMALPGSASAPAVDRRRDDLAYDAGIAIMELIRQGIRPRPIMTRQAFEHALAGPLAPGGPPNAALPLLPLPPEAAARLPPSGFTPHPPH